MKGNACIYVRMYGLFLLCLEILYLDVDDSRLDTFPGEARI